MTNNDSISNPASRTEPRSMQRPPSKGVLSRKTFIGWMVLSILSIAASQQVARAQQPTSLTISDFPRYATALNDSQRNELRRFARALVGATLAGARTSVNITGHADFDSKGRDFELSVSQERARGAEAALKSLVMEEAAKVGLSANALGAISYQTVGVGTRNPLFSNPRSEEERRGNRRVEFTWSSAGPTPPPAPTPSTSSTLFEIRVVGGFSGAALFQADNYIFQIVDLTKRQTAFYHYTGGGIGISLSKIPGPGSVTKAGSPTKFQTTRPTELHQFNSKASLFQDPGATIGNKSIFGTLRLSIDEIRGSDGNFIFTKPNIVPIEGGAGVQMPGLGSVTTGVLALHSAVFPFSGY